jgi:cytidylate kinase
MIITIGGTAGSGKSTMAKLLAKKLGYKHYSMGDLQREIAKKKNISLIELGRMEEEDKNLDKEVDQRQVELGKKEDNFVIDARLGFHFIPNSVKIFLDADFDERTKRILADRVRKEKNVDLENTKGNMKVRKASEQKRYKTYYNIDPYNKKHYDLIIDTTDKKPKEVVEEILLFIEKKK